MSFTAGDFTPSVIGAMIVKEKNAVATSRTSELSKDIIVGAAMLGHQDPLIDIGGQGFGQSCTNAKLYTNRVGSTDKGSTTMACAVSTGPEAGTESLTVDKSVLVNIERFLIQEDFCKNAETFTSVFADLMTRSKANLELKLSKAITALLSTNADTPVATWFKVPGTVSGTIYQVVEAEFTSELLADAQWAGKMLGLADPIILNGRNFYNESILERYKHSGCCTNDAILNRNQVFQVYWDSLNIDQVTGASSTFVVDKNAILFWSSPMYSNMGIESMLTVGREPADRFHYVDTLPRLQYYANGKWNPIYVDVRAEWSCATDTQNVPRTSWKFEVSLAGALTANLEDQDDRQGIIRIDQITGV